MGRLTTHVLDVARGRPAAGLAVTLYAADGERRELTTAMTNSDGRCGSPLLEGGALKTGIYEMVFDTGAYFDRLGGLDLPEPKFLDEVVIRFGIADPEQHYHVPLLLSPFGYSTYRGS
ncbi:MAG TPA: hydroxyisourate hydrolase [Afifellaceae bacterium]|nr:hydroxyisourate hydrolase [Afifellaceae bacterium]